MKRERGLRYLPPAGSLRELTPKHRAIIVLLVHGLDRPHAAFPNLAVGQPLTANECADVLGLRRKYVRRLLNEAVFRTELNAAAHALRASAVPKALRQMIDLMDWQGDGRAADAKVRLEAAKAILGEDGASLSVNVNVASQTNVGIRPGYVLRLPPEPAPSTLDAKPDATDSEPE